MKTGLTPPQPKSPYQAVKPHPNDFPTEEIFLQALNKWKRHQKGIISPSRRYSNDYQPKYDL